MPETTTTAVETAAPRTVVPEVMPIDKARSAIAELSRSLLDAGEAIIAQCDPDDEGTIERLELFLTSRVVPARKRLKDIFDPICNLTHQAHKAATSTRAELDEPLAKLETEAKAASLEARNEINRRIEEAERQEREEAARVARETAEREAAELREKAERDAEAARQQAAELEAAGRKDEAAAVVAQAEQHQQHVETVATAVVEEAAAAPATSFLPARPRSAPTSGVSYREEWYAQVDDLKALCRAVADGTAPEDAVLPNMPKLNGMASAMKKALRVPGVSAHSRQGVAARRRG